MEIAIVCYPTTGGSGVVATELAAALSRRNHRVHLVASEEPVRFTGETETLKMHRVTVPRYDLFPDGSYGLAVACRLGEVLEENDLDVIHSHYAFPHAISGYLARDLFSERDAKLISTLHGTDIYFGEQHRCHYNIVKAALQRADRVTAVSRFLVNETERIYDIDVSNFEVIPNFVDTDRFQPVSREPGADEFLPDDVPVLMHVSNFRTIKNPLDPIHVLRFVLEAGQDAHLVMVGDGPERQRAESLVSEFHIREHVTFTGQRSDVPDILPGADLMLVTSEKESFGMAALEALACGVPVLNSSEGGLRELLEDGLQGYHLEPGDRFAMAEKAVELLGDSGQLNRLRENARTLVRDKYSMEHVIPRYEDLYRGVKENK